MCAACASLSGRDAERERGEALRDDARCVADGAQFPSVDYTACRLRLAEQRQRKNVEQLTLASRAAANRTYDTSLAAPPGEYRAIDPERFVCEERTRAGERIVACAER